MTSPPLMVHVQGVGKRYRLGTTNRQQLTDDFKALMYRLRGKPDPTIPLGQAIDPQRIGEDFWALRDINFQVRKGEVVGIIGRNGAGKSTLLKLLSRITLPTEGEIKMRGKISSLLEVGTGFHPELTGRDNIYLNGAILGMRRHEVDAKLDEIIAFSGITHHIDTPVKRYSSGMRVRLGFAVAAHLEPEILIVDEVLSVGDAEFQRKSMGKMKDSAKSGRTVLFVSHNMTAVRSLCSRVIWLENGRIRMQGDTEEVVNAYLADYSEDRTEVVWDDPTTAPGNELAKLRYVRVKPKPGEHLFKWENELNLEIGLDNLNADGHDLGLTVQVAASDGTVLITSNLRDCIPKAVFTKGVNRLVILLPGYLLNSGTFQINISVGYKSKGLFRVDNVVNFEMQDSIRTGFWHGKRQGYFKLVVPWGFAYNTSEFNQN